MSKNIPTIDINCSRHENYIGTSFYCDYKNNSYFSGYDRVVERSSYPSGNDNAGDSGAYQGYSSDGINDNIGNNDKLDLRNHISSLQSKFSTYNVGYGKIHNNPIIGNNDYNQGIQFIEEIINTIRMNVAKGTLHHKLVINAYNRGIVDGDL